MSKGDLCVALLSCGAGFHGGARLLLVAMVTSLLGCRGYQSSGLPWLPVFWVAMVFILFDSHVLSFPAII